LKQGSSGRIISAMSKHEPVKQLNLKDNETYELASQVARLHGTSLNAAVKAALEEKLKRDVRALSLEREIARITALAESYSARVGPRTMTDDEAIGYDEHGLPT
jgi:antitoxin VapB